MEQTRLSGTEFWVWVGLIAVAAALYLCPSATSPGEDDEKAGKKATPNPNWLTLLQLEYTKAAERYENIYKAVWQNFSYMAVVAGGILTFGSHELGSRAALYFLALTPLFFWLIATFLPLDHYGDSIRKRLRGIEGDINRIYFADEGAPRLAHFIWFEDIHYKWRVRHAVRAFGVVVTLAWLYFGVLFGGEVVSKYTNPPQATGLFITPPQQAPQTLGTPVARDSLRVLEKRVHSFDSLLQYYLH